MRILTVRWDDFEAAFIIGSPDARYFLNLLTGEVEYTSHMDGETVKERVLAKVAAGDFLEITRPSFDVAMDEVTSFIGSEAPDVQAQLNDGMQQHKSPFLGFNRAMGSDVELRRRWSAHRQAGIERRLVAFCKHHDLAIDDERFHSLVRTHSDA